MITHEQLEYAAKAYWGEEFEDVGIRWSEEDDGLLYIHADNQDHNGLDCELVWAPHRYQDHSDNMACKLRIDLYHFNVEGRGRSVRAVASGSTNEANVNHNNTDEDVCRAVREARMLVAVEIGRRK
jgi:hypothetical protein